MNGLSSVPSLGVVTHAVGRDPMPFTGCLQKIASTGAEHIFLLTAPCGPVIRPGQPPAQSQLPNILESDPDEVIRLAAAAGLRISCLHAGARLNVNNKSAAADGLKAVTPFRDCAVRLGCGLLSLPAPAAAAQGVSPGEKQSQLRRLAGLMDALAAGAIGALAVGVDIHYGSLVENLDDCRCLVDAMKEPRAGLLLNVGHLTTARQEGWRLVEECPARIHAVGWKDHSLKPDRPSPVYSIELGRGDSPFDRYIRAFKRHATRAVHLVNVEDAPKGDEMPTLRRSIAYLKKLWPEVR